jgi:putative transposase
VGRTEGDLRRRRGDVRTSGYGGTAFAMSSHVSLPREIVPGATYMVTRRCTQREFLLKPSALTNQIFLYCLGVAAARTGVIVHAVCVLSNHYHAIVTDPFGRLPEFYGWLHEFVGKALNASYGRWENLWSTEATSCVRLVDADAVLDKVVYTLTNPVAAGLVSHGARWPGVRLHRPERTLIERPNVFFRENGPTPGQVVLELVPPPLGVADVDATAIVERSVATREAAHRAAAHRKRKRFLGARAILRQRITDRPSTREPRRKLSPRVAGRNKWARIEALQRCKRFVAAYRDAWRRWCAGAADVMFPAGTYLMARRYAVAVIET